MPRLASGRLRVSFIRQDGPNFKTPNVVSPIARKNAREQDCTLCLPCCNHDRSTVSLCHLRMFGAAGMAEKPDDWFAVFACSACHDALDRRNSMTAGLWGFEDVLIALHRTLKTQFAAGIWTPGNRKG